MGWFEPHFMCDGHGCPGCTGGVIDVESPGRACPMICPTCKGDGYRLRHSVIPGDAEEVPCGGCRGTGQVGGDRVRSTDQDREARARLCAAIERAESSTSRARRDRDALALVVVERRKAKLQIRLSEMEIEDAILSGAPRREVREALEGWASARDMAAHWTRQVRAEWGLLTRPARDVRAA